MLKGEKQLLKTVLWPPHTCAHNISTHTYTHTPTYTQYVHFTMWYAQFSNHIKRYRKHFYHSFKIIFMSEPSFKSFSVFLLLFKIMFHFQISKSFLSLIFIYLYCKYVIFQKKCIMNFSLSWDVYFCCCYFVMLIACHKQLKKVPCVVGCFVLYLSIRPRWRDCRSVHTFSHCLEVSCFTLKEGV